MALGAGHDQGSLSVSSLSTNVWVRTMRKEQRHASFIAMRGCERESRNAVGIAVIWVGAMTKICL